MPSVEEARVLETLAKEISAFANSGGGQLVFGLVNPSTAIDKWTVDDGGISTSMKGKTGTREWLEDVIPNLVEFPLTDFNVYAITPIGQSQISLGRALYIVDIADSLGAPHQSRIDNKYYARVAGKSRPIGHKMVADIMGRRQHPKIELEFEIEKKFIKGEQPGMFPQYTYLGTRPPEKDTNTYKLVIWARNTGRVYAQYVNSFIYIPIQLLPNQQVKVFGGGRAEKIEGRDYLRYYEENTKRDVIGSKGFQTEYGPSRFDPILPGLSCRWEIELKQNIGNLERDDLFIKWTTYADNGVPISGETKVKDIKVIDAFEPNFDALHEEDDE